MMQLSQRLAERITAEIMDAEDSDGLVQHGTHARITRNNAILESWDRKHLEHAVMLAIRRFFPGGDATINVSDTDKDAADRALDE